MKRIAFTMMLVFASFTGFAGENNACFIPKGSIGCGITF